MKHIYTAIGVAGAVFGIVYSGSNVTQAGTAATVGFLLVISYEYWRRERERKRRRAEKQFLNKVVAALRQQNS